MNRNCAQSMDPLSFSAGAFVALAATLMTATPAYAAPILYVVNSSGEGNDPAQGDGICETAIGNGICTLRAAIQESNGHVGTDGIRFSIPTTDPGYDPQTGVHTIHVSNALPVISDNVNLSGPGANKLTVTSEFFSTRIFSVTTSGTVNIAGITIAKGTARTGESGGGIRNLNSGTVNIINCVLRGNKAGGGNPFTGGGAIGNDALGTVNVTTSTLSHNVAIGGRTPHGGGIFNRSGTVTVVNSTFDDNHTEWSGGGIYNAGGLVTVTGSTFRNNGAGRSGGGIGNDGVLNVSNSTFYANVAYIADDSIDEVGGRGGGIVNFDTLNLTNSTFTANLAADLGSGLYNASSGTTAHVKSTIVAQNLDGTSGRFGACPDVCGTFISHGFNLVGKRNGSTGFTAATDKTGTVTNPLNPKFDSKGLRSNGGPTQTLALTATSPAIDAASSAGLTGTLTTDQRGTGFPRTVNKAPANATGGDGTDIGAYELQ